MKRHSCHSSTGDARNTPAPAAILRRVANASSGSVTISSLLPWLMAWYGPDRKARIGLYRRKAIDAPTAKAMAEMMSRRLSSVRCSMSVIRPPPDSPSSRPGSSVSRAMTGSYESPFADGGVAHSDGMPPAVAGGAGGGAGARSGRPHSPADDCPAAGGVGVGAVGAGVGAGGDDGLRSWGAG